MRPMRIIRVIAVGMFVLISIYLLQNIARKLVRET